MDNSAQNDQQMPQSSTPSTNPVGDQPVQQPVPVQQTPVQAPIQQPAAPAGKEVAPASTAADAIAIPKPEEQWVQETAPEAKISQELKDAGVETAKGEAVPVGPDVAAAGVVPTGPTIPVPAEPSIKLPIPEEKAQKVLLHKKVRDSLTWLAMLVIRQIQFMQFKKKEAKS